jgi:hypothetical protein
MAKSPKASALIDTRVIYCGDDLDQLRTPEACGDLILAVQAFLPFRALNRGETNSARNSQPPPQD